MRHGSLFSGIGGFDLASEWMGWENVFHCEWNDFGKQVLKYYWPKATSYDDITKTDFNIHRGRIDILTGGFPCQPYSTAGKRLGKEDDRHLWPEMLRAIREIQPTWVVGENVLGIVNWNEGMVFNEVQADLEAEGYEVQPYVLPAASVNAPHRRDRTWFIAYSGHSKSQKREEFKERQQYVGGRESRGESASLSSTRSITNAKSKQSKRVQPEQREFSNKKQREFRGNNSEMGNGNITNSKCSGSPREEHGKTEPGQPTKKNPGIRWRNFPNESPIYNGNDGIPPELDGITFPKWRNESIKAGGNAIVPQVAHQIFKTIEKYNEL